MQKFIPTNKDLKTQIFVTDYNWPLEETLAGRAVVVRVQRPEDIVRIRGNFQAPTKLEAFVYRNDYASLETIDVDPEWGSTPIILYLNRLGKFRDVHEKVNELRRLNVMVIFTGNERQACTDAQILSSLGIHTGIELRPDRVPGEAVLDLLTYNFYSVMPHGEIEPFSSMERNYDTEHYVSPEVAMFHNPGRFVHIDKDRRLAFSAGDMAEGRVLDATYPEISQKAFEEAMEADALAWQQMFVEAHPCTFCPAFRVCTGFFRDAEDHGEKCTKLMSELLSSIEFQKKKNQQNQEEKCQL